MEHVLPQVGGGVALRVGGVARAAVPARAIAALVEGQEEGVLARQPGGHPDLGVVHGEEAQYAPVELEADFPGVPVNHPLPPGVLRRLPGVRVFQLEGEHGNAVHRQHQIHRIVALGRIEPLAVAADAVFPIQRRRRPVQRGLRLKIAHAEGNAPVLEPVPQHRDEAVHLAGIAERRAELPNGVHLVRVLKPRPRLRLGALNEADQRVRKQPQLRVVDIVVARVAAFGPQGGGDVVFEALFGGVGDGHKRISLTIYFGNLVIRSVKKGMNGANTVM